MKRILLIALALMLVAAGSFATETRVLTMGDNNRILLDEANIFLFPSRIVDYPNLALAEFSSNDLAEFGVHWKLDEKRPFVLGTYLHNNTAQNHTYAPIAAPLGENKRIDLFYGTKLGLHKAGFHFGLRHSSNKDDAVDDKDVTSLSIWNFDFGLTPNGDNIDVAAGIELLTWAQKGTKPADSTEYDITKPSGNMKFYLVGRMFHKVNSLVTVAPHAEFSYGKYEYDAYNQVPPYALANTNKNTVLRFDIGAGQQYTPATNVLAVLDFGVMLDNVKNEFTVGNTTTETTTNTFVLPYFKMGFDADVFKWLDLRLGATSYWKNLTINNKTADDKNIKKWPDNETYMGLGFHWNRLHVDAQANPDLFLKGFNFISGQTATMNYRLSAVYEMM